jgi:murein DD-endopeptidase MepM/ murein hydrolase activator NlpD
MARKSMLKRRIAYALQPLTPDLRRRFRPAAYVVPVAVCLFLLGTVLSFGQEQPGTGGDEAGRGPRQESNPDVTIPTVIEHMPIPEGWPLADGRGRITLAYGEAVHPIRGGTFFHHGVDIAYRTGTPVLATAAGTVKEVGFDQDGRGRFLLIVHGPGIETYYAHLEEVAVSPGTTVTAGMIVGTLGNTGVSTGPHLHYEIRVDGPGETVDPGLYFDSSGISRDAPRQTR